MENYNLEDGLYFGLPEDVYHKIPALSSSGIKNILISPTDFYARSWMNNAKEDEETGNPRDDWRVIGKAFHSRILEGKAVFDKAFAPEFVPPSDCLKTVDEIKAALKALGIKTTGNKPELIASLMLAAPTSRIYDVMAEQHTEKNKGKSLLSQDLLAKIEISAAMIERHPQLSLCFKNGFPEVTIIWTQEFDNDGKTEQVKFKARFDYLKLFSVIDLKTFSNTQDKPIDTVIYQTIAAKKYHIQAAFYLDAIPHVRAAIETGNVIYSPEYLAEQGHTQETFEAWLTSFTNNTESHEFYFVFQQKGVAPLARLKKFPRTSIYRVGAVQIEAGINQFIKYRSMYGNDYWVDDSPCEELDDMLFPAYIGQL